MTDFGIWTENDGGFVETQLYSREAADRRLVELFEEDLDNVGDLTVVEICDYHEEQPKDGCEECNAEEEES